MSLRAPHIVLLLLMAVPVAAQGKAPLRDVPQIDDALFTIGLADQIRKTCPTISSRMLAALNALSKLQQTARDMGYTRAEIDAHIDSDVEKDRLRVRAQEYFAQRGVAQDQAGYCTLGEMEIAEASDVGRLLRVDR